MWRRAGALLAFLLSLSAYVATAAPSLWWLDSSEFAAASFELGIAHPPGHPLAVLLGKLCMLLPFGSLAFRANLASALAAAGAAAVLFLLAWDLHGSVRDAIQGRRHGPLPLGAPWTRFMVALGAALLLSLSASAWMQATRAEVYALNLLLLLVALHRLLAWDRGDRPALGQAAFVLGLGLGNHHLLVLLFAAVAVPWVLAKRAWRAVARATAMGLLGACVLLYLPIRAAQWPEVNWGAPVDMSRLGWVLSARAFQHTAARVSAEPLAPRVEGVGWLPVEQLGLGAAAALGGLYLLLRARATRRTGILILGAGAAVAAGPLLVGFDPFNPDAHGYLATMVAAGALCAAAFAAGAEAILLGAQRPRLAAAMGPALLALGLAQAARHGATVDLRAAWGAEETALAVIEPVPTEGVLHTALYKTAFNLWYLRIAEGLRPDARHLHVGFLGFPGYRESVARRDAALLTARPDVAEYYEDMPDAVVERLGPAGPVLRVGGSVEEHRVRMRNLERRAADGGEHEAGRALLYAHYIAAQYFCRVGNVAEAKREVAQARRRSTSPLLDDLLQRCGQ